MRLLFYMLFLFPFSFQALGQSDSGYLTEDGAWCWFSDPRAILADDYVFTGWVKADGTVEAARLNTNSQRVRTSELYFRLEKDDHNNPAFVFTQSGKLLAMYTRHSKKDLFINVLENYRTHFEFGKPQLIHPISKEQLNKFPRETITYANPFRLKAENNILYCFGRWTGFKPNLMSSTNGGATWTHGKVFITNYPFDKNNRPYVKYFSDGISKIHIVFTDGHPRVEPTNSVYYALFENGKFYKANGDLICNIENIPFEPKDASVVYHSNQKQGRAWIADIAQDKHGNPVILFTKSPDETNHEYWYARYYQNQWRTHKICDSGNWFPQTPAGEQEREPHYFGNLTIHPQKCNVVYLSRQINGVFEIERHQTKDLGKTWSKQAITQNSKFDNVRPFVPRGLKAEQDEIVLWMENQKYIHYTDFQTAIKYHILKNSQ